MTLEQIQGINEINAGDIISKIRKNERKIKYGDKLLTIEQVLKQFDPNQHAVYDRALRKDKLIQVPASDHTDAEPNMINELVMVNRSSNPAQKLIVNRANAFLTGNPIEIICDPQTPMEKNVKAILQRLWDINKMDYKTNEIGEKQMSETHVALIFYFADMDEDENDFSGLDFESGGLTLRLKIACKSKGDDLYPIFDKMGKMIAFCRAYTDTDDDDVSRQIVEIYTAANTIIVTEENPGTYKIDRKVNLVKKIPVIYFAQDQPEWLDVQHNIERSEELISNFGDTNDYFSSPTTVVKGEIEGFSKKGERGKVLEIGEDAEVDLLEWSNATEAVDLENKTQDRIIMAGTQTPDISFDSMKDLPAYSGIALRMLFFDASLKVKAKAPTYGESIQRIFNYFKAVIRKLDIRYEEAATMPVKPKIEPYMPQNTEERIGLLSSSSEKPIISQETAVRLNPMVEDKEREIELLAIEEKKDAELQFGQFQGQ